MWIKALFCEMNGIAAMCQWRPPVCLLLKRCTTLVFCSWIRTWRVFRPFSLLSFSSLNCDLCPMNDTWLVDLFPCFWITIIEKHFLILHGFHFASMRQIVNDLVKHQYLKVWNCWTFGLRLCGCPVTVEMFLGSALDFCHQCFYVSFVSNYILLIDCFIHSCISYCIWGIVLGFFYQCDFSIGN